MASKTTHRRVKAPVLKNAAQNKRTNRKNLLAAESRKPSARIANRKQIERKLRIDQNRNSPTFSVDSETERLQHEVQDTGIEGRQISALLTSDQFKQMLTQLSNTLIHEFIDQTRTKIQRESEKVQKAISKITKPLDKRISVIDTATTQKLESLRGIIDNVLGDKPCSCRTSETTTIENNFRKKKITKKQKTVLETFPTSEDLTDEFESLPVITFDSEPVQSTESDPIPLQRKLSYPFEHEYEAFPNQMSSDLDCVDRNNISCDSIFDQEHSLSEHCHVLETQFGFADEANDAPIFIDLQSNLLKLDILKTEEYPFQQNLYSGELGCGLNEGSFECVNPDEGEHKGWTADDDLYSATNASEDLRPSSFDFTCRAYELASDLPALDQ